ncbi:MAG: tetratricopeptide repeat protein [Muribaculaceae bacterium]|nr:tetratricopeptide repeat protein [Muribaculaceae bacterium]
MGIRNILIGMTMIIALAGCSVSKIPPFTSSRWALAGNVASSTRHGVAINFGGESVFPMTNLSNGEYELNFITTDEQFQAYAPYCKDYIASAISFIPMKIDSLELVLADQFVVFSPNLLSEWMPDYVRQADGSEFVVEANPRATAIQPHDEIWRNFVFDDKRHRILVVDRIVKNGKHLGIVYIMQGEDKHVPFSGNFHYDITARRNIQPVGEHMRALLEITIAASNSKVKPRTYGECVHAADSCFMAGDFSGAYRQFEMAFATGNEIHGAHLYNAACAAALAGEKNAAFAWLNARLNKEPDWYVDDPAADNDLASLHDDARWSNYVDTLMARRDRIEANFDKPLRAQLQEIAQSDQSIRYEFLEAYRAAGQNQALIDSLTHAMQRVDSINQAAICHILDTRGFVGSDKVGNACAVFWLVIQHAPVELQKKYFPLFEQASQRGDISQECIAMMDDRIAMFEGRPQKYGSQIVDGRLYQLLDPEKVDQWRHDMGMPPLADYLMQMGISH